jgi:hypothetical protein
VYQQGAVDIFLDYAGTLAAVPVGLGHDLDDFVEVSGHLYTITAISILARLQDPDILHRRAALVILWGCWLCTFSCL